MKNLSKCVLIFTTILLILWAGCSKNSSKKKQIIITYKRWANPSEVESTKELLKLFEKRYPNIKVEFTSEPWGAYWDKIQTQFAAGEAPDVFLIGATYIADFYSKGLLLNLQPYIERDKKELDLNDFFKPPFELYTFNGNLYALPRDINSIVLFYNKDLFDRFGLPYPDETWTWKDIISAGKKLTVDENKDGIIDYWGFLNSLDYEIGWGNFVLQNKGRLLTPDKRRCIANSPPVVEALQFLYDLEHKYRIAPDSAAKESLGEQVFQTGRVAMRFDGSWMIGTYKSTITGFKWDIAVLPKGKVRACIANGVAHAINAKTKHPEEAWLLVKFLSSKEAQIALAKSATSIPVRKSIAYSKYFLDGVPENKKACLEMIKYGHNYPVTPEMNYWLLDIMARELQLAFLGKKSIKKALDDATREVNKVLKEIYNKQEL